VTYDLPFGKGKTFGSNWNGALNAIAGGWEVDAIERAISGFPLFVVDSTNNSGVNFQWNGNSLNRPELAPGCNPKSSHPTLTQWFNTSCFLDDETFDTQFAGKLGNAPRAPVSGPRFINTDMSFIKHILLHEGMRLDFRAEFFNILNHPHFYLPGGSSGMQDISSPATFGKASATLNDPRFIQLAMKLVF